MTHTTESIWDMFCCKLKPFVMKWVSDTNTADDIIQEVFIKIHENIDSLQDSSKVHSWVLMITRNTVFDYLRKRKIQFEELHDDVWDEGEDFEKSEGEIHSELTNEIHSGIRSMIEVLPEKYRQALILVEYDGLSQVELAITLHLSPSGAKSRVQRARKMVRELLLNCCHYEFDRYGSAIGVKPKVCHCCKES